MTNITENRTRALGFPSAQSRDMAAYVILSPENRHVATIQAVCIDKVLTLNVYAAEKNMPVSRNYTGRQCLVMGRPWRKEMDRLLDGIVIDGIRLYGEPATDYVTEAMLNGYQHDVVKSNGMSWAEHRVWFERAQGIGAVFLNQRTELKYKAGLGRLALMKYRVFRAL